MSTERLRRTVERVRQRAAPNSGVRSGNDRTRGSSNTVLQTATARPATLQDISLKIGERGFIVGMTETGKSTLAERLIFTWLEENKDGYVIILDSKPRFRAEWELSGIPTSASGRYSKWDWGPGPFPGSVVLPLRDTSQEINMALSLRYRVLIAQVDDRFKDIGKLDTVVRTAYSNRKKGRKLLFYVDETNNFFRSANASTGAGIVMVLTSGRERYISALLAGQRPRHVSVEAMECMTKLYSFYFPYQEDVKHLRGMGIPSHWRIPTYPIQDHVFSFYDRKSSKYGMCRVQPVPWSNAGKKKGK